MKRAKLLLIFLLLIFIGCQQDELTIYRYRKDADIRVETPRSFTAAARQCPRCDRNEYCNSETGKCEARAYNKPAEKPDTTKPVSTTPEPEPTQTQKYHPKITGDIFLVDKIGTFDPRYDTIPTYPKY